MPHKAEIELKLELRNSDMRALAQNATLRQSATRAKTEELASTYFDTAKMKLRKHGVSLRVRHIGDRYMQTIKRDRPGDGAALGCDEWECEVADGRPDLDSASGTALEPLLTRKTRRSLKPIFETVIRRTVHPITLDGTEIELASTKDRSMMAANHRHSARQNSNCSGGMVLSYFGWHVVHSGLHQHAGFAGF
jgi:inorganic triphosphatase YgiF